MNKNSLYKQQAHRDKPSHKVDSELRDLAVEGLSSLLGSPSHLPPWSWEANGQCLEQRPSASENCVGSLCHASWFSEMVLDC